MQSETLRLGRLTEIFANDKTALRNFLIVLIAEIARLERDIVDSCRRDEWDRAKRRLHEFKGICANVGCSEAGATAAEFETIVREHRCDEVPAHIERLHGIVQRMRDAIAARLAA